MTKRPMIKLALLLGLIFSLSACGTARAASTRPAGPGAEAAETAQQAGPGTQAAETTEPATTETPKEVQRTMLQMKIGETDVKVAWEDNASVAALQELCKDKPLTIQMSMYGGFEQVGPIGTRLPSDDVQTSTSAGDIVLYTGSQLVVFYGSNSWAYTRLGHIEDRDAAGMAALLGKGDVTITLAAEKAE